MLLKQRLAAINARLAAIDTELATADATGIEKLSTESATLISERGGITEKMRAEARSAMNAPAAEVVVPEERKVSEEEIQQRARDLKQGRSVTIDSVDLLHIEHQDTNPNPAFNEVALLADLVGKQHFERGETYEKAYVKGYGEADYTAEGVAANTSEPSFGYATIQKAKITAYSEVSEEVEKLAPAAYLTEVKKNLSISLKKKLNKEVISGAGDSAAITGLFNKAKATAIAADDIEISVIDNTTLDNIIYAYGGNEDFAAGTLILNKQTLKEFDVLKDGNGRKYHTVNRATKTIDGVPYVITSAVKAFGTAAVGDYVLAYGSLPNYELTSFGPSEISRSSDYKFKEGMIAYKIVGFFGGNVVSYNGFTRVKKIAAA